VAEGVRTSVGDARTVLRRTQNLVELVSEAEHGRQSLRHGIEAAFTALREQMVRRELANIPVARLRDTTEGRLRIRPLEQAGLPTVLEVHDSSPGRLQRGGPLVAHQSAGEQALVCVLFGPRAEHSEYPDWRSQPMRSTRSDII
jgi:hypothetical protein